MGKLEEAKSYIHLAIKEGYLSEDTVEGMSNKELIEFAQKEGARGDAQINS